MNSHYLKNAASAAKSFLEDMPVDIQLHKLHETIASENRKTLESIVSVILFCGIHDLPLRGKQLVDGVFFSLLNFRIDSGDINLKNHLERSQKMRNILLHIFKTSS